MSEIELEIQKLLKRVAEGGGGTFTPVEQTVLQVRTYATMFALRTKHVQWSRDYISDAKQRGGDNFIERTQQESNRLFIISGRIWINLISGAYMPVGVGLHDLIDPVARYDQVLDGRLGAFTVNGNLLFTDSYLEPEFHILQDDEFVELPIDAPIERILMMQSYIVPLTEGVLKSQGVDIAKM